MSPEVYPAVGQLDLDHVVGRHVPNAQPRPQPVVGLGRLTKRGVGLVDRQCAQGRVGRHVINRIDRVCGPLQRRAENCRPTATWHRPPRESTWPHQDAPRVKVVKIPVGNRAAVAQIGIGIDRLIVARISIAVGINRAVESQVVVRVFDLDATQAAAGIRLNEVLPASAFENIVCSVPVDEVRARPAVDIGQAAAADEGVGTRSAVNDLGSAAPDNFVGARPAKEPIVLWAAVDRGVA